MRDRLAASPDATRDRDHHHQPSMPSSSHHHNPTRRRCDAACDRSKSLLIIKSGNNDSGRCLRTLVPKHVVVLSQGERIDTDAFKHFGIELPRPVHKRRGKHAVREVALRHKKHRHRDTYVITHSFAAIPYSTQRSSKRSSNRPQPCHPQRNA